MDNAGLVYVLQGHSNFSRNGYDELFLESMVRRRFQQSCHTASRAVIADDPQACVEVECFVDYVDVLGALVFKGLQNFYLTKELFEGVVSILRILLIVLPISFDDFYSAYLLVSAVLAERILAILFGRQCQERLFTS